MREAPSSKCSVSTSSRQPDPSSRRVKQRLPGESPAVLDRGADERAGQVDRTIGAAIEVSAEAAGLLVQ